MMSQWKVMLDSIQDVNADSRVGLVMTIPPASHYGCAVSGDCSSEMVLFIGLLTWYKYLLADFDTPANKLLKRYLIAGNLNFDTEYNYPSGTFPANSRNSTLVTMQTDNVHPTTAGYATMADNYAAIIKYFE